MRTKTVTCYYPQHFLLLIILYIRLLLSLAPITRVKFWAPSHRAVPDFELIATVRVIVFRFLLVVVDRSRVDLANCIL